MPPFDTSLTIAPSILDRLLDDDPRTASPFFSLSDLLNPPGLALKLRNHEETITDLIREQCRPEIQSGIDALDGTSTVPTDLQEGMIEGLNTLIDGECIYEPKRFQALPKAAHNDTQTMGGSAYWESLERFMADLTTGDFPSN